ncbi:MAG: trypsin-like peptidase domain-containing protein [Candidatus Parcubacteria bacterium]|nr:trypsin-like peptidase domain-containing protein [Candidatus Paceibacterota bacterium]
MNTNSQTPTPNTQKSIKKIKVKSQNYVLPVVVILVTLFLMLPFLSYFILSTNPQVSKNSQSSSWLSNILGTDTNSASKPSNKNAEVFNFVPEKDTKTTGALITQSLPSILSIRVKTGGLRATALGESAGTGYFVSTDGLVVTNRHVIASACKQSLGASATITGLASDQKAYQLELLTIDPVDDIAVLKVKNPGTDTFKPVEFADSSKSSLGTDVLAIGNVLGEFNNSVTKGIVSGLDRSLSTQLTDECTGKNITSEGLIQTDAAINKGNSGGPLFDARGLVIGMNTFGTSEGQNIGFAIPSNTIINSLNSFKEFGKITRPQLGVSTISIDKARQLENPWLPTDYGELIFAQTGSAISPGSSAQKAGLTDGDIILEINGKKLKSTSDQISPLRKEILNNKPAQEIELTVLKSQTPTGKQVQSDAFSYQATPVKIKATLGSINFSLNNISDK